MKRMLPVIAMTIGIWACSEHSLPDPTPLSESPVVVFDATTGKAVSALWRYSDARISLRVETQKAKKRSLGYAATIYAALPDVAETEIFSCKGIRSVGGRVDLVLRGTDLHIQCINPPVGTYRGRTDAARFQFHPDRLRLEATGTYGGEGIVDLDTIDFSEGIDETQVGH